jgi:hypothetical protein
MIDQPAGAMNVFPATVVFGVSAPMVSAVGSVGVGAGIAAGAGAGGASAG